MYFVLWLNKFRLWAWNSISANTHINVTPLPKLCTKLIKRGCWDVYITFSYCSPSPSWGEECMYGEVLLTCHSILLVYLIMFCFIFKSLTVIWFKSVVMSPLGNRESLWKRQLSNISMSEGNKTMFWLIWNPSMKLGSEFTIWRGKSTVWQYINTESLHFCIMLKVLMFNSGWHGW